MIYNVHEEVRRSSLINFDSTSTSSSSATVKTGTGSKHSNHEKQSHFSHEDARLALVGLIKIKRKFFPSKKFDLVKTLLKESEDVDVLTECFKFELSDRDVMEGITLWEHEKEVRRSIFGKFRGNPQGTNSWSSDVTLLLKYLTHDKDLIVPILLDIASTKLGRLEISANALFPRALPSFPPSLLRLFCSDPCFTNILLTCRGAMSKILLQAERGDKDAAKGLVNIAVGMAKFEQWAQ